MKNQNTLKKSIVLILGVTLACNQARGQLVTENEAPAEMKQLDFLVGTWEGKGTITRGPNETSEADVVENVQMKLQGTVLLIEGRGTVPQDGGGEMIVHDALAVISYDKENKRFVMRTYRAGGEMLEPEIEVTPNKLVWQFNEPRRNGQIRFTISVDDKGMWQEKGEFSANGENWFPFFSMNLKKKSKE
jgi:hypothetical protein